MSERRNGNDAADGRGTPRSTGHDGHFPPTPGLPMPVEVIAGGAATGHDGWHPPTRRYPLPVEVISPSGIVIGVPEAPDDPLPHGRIGNTLLPRWEPVLPLSGDTPMQGPLVLAREPVLDREAATKLYVDQLSAASPMYRGVWDVAINTPDLNAIPLANGYFWFARTADPGTFELVPPPGLPGVGTFTRVWNGDRLHWNAGLSRFDLIRAGSLDKTAADELFLPLGGNHPIINPVTGPIWLMAGPPTEDRHATNKAYVDEAIAGSSLWRGVWEVATNTPDLGTIALQNGYSWTAVTPDPLVDEPTIIDLPGLPIGTMISNGDTIRFATLPSPAFVRIHVGGISKPEADQLYLVKAGDQMQGPLSLAAMPIQPLEAVPKDYVDQELAELVTRVSEIAAEKVNRGGDVITGVLHINGGPGAGLRIAGGGFLLVDGGPVMVNVGDVTAAGGNFLLTMDGRGYRFGVNGIEGGLYKAVGTGIVLRQSSGNQQPQIENADGSGRRPIIDQTSGDARYVRRTGDNALDTRYVNLTGDTLSGPLYFENTSNFARPIVRGANANTEVLGLDMEAGGLIGRIGARRTGYFINPEANVYCQVGSGGYGHRIVWTAYFGGQGRPGDRPLFYVGGDVSADEYVTRSDRALKDEIVELDGAETKTGFAGLKPVRFRRKAPAAPEGRAAPESPFEFGLVAQDVEAACPGLVNADGQGVKGYSLSGVVALTIAKVHELDRRERRTRRATAALGALLVVGTLAWSSGAVSPPAGLWPAVWNWVRPSAAAAVAKTTRPTPGDLRHKN